MNLSRRERRVAIAGAVVAVLTILVAWVFVPLARSWSRLGGQLEPQLQMLDVLRTRAGQQERLIARRSRLVRQLGSLLGGGEKSGEATGKAPAPEGQKSPGSDSGSKPDPAPTTPAPGLDADLGRIIKKAGAKLKVISAAKAPRPPVSCRHFRAVLLRVETENNAESLVKMLHAVENGARFMRVQGLKIHQDSKKPGSLRVTMSVLGYGPADET